MRIHGRERGALHDAAAALAARFKASFKKNESIRPSRRRRRRDEKKNESIRPSRPRRRRDEKRKERIRRDRAQRPENTQAATLERVAPTAPIFSDVCSETGVTLSRFMIETALANPELSELESIFSSIETASKTISNLVRRSSLTGLTGYLDSGNINIQGEEQKKLDVITNDVLKNALRYTGRMGVLASEEEDAPVEVDDDIEEKYQKEVLVEKTRGEYEDDGAFASTLETRMCLCVAISRGRRRP